MSQLRQSSERNHVGDCPNSENSLNDVNNSRIVSEKQLGGIATMKRMERLVATRILYLKLRHQLSIEPQLLFERFRMLMRKLLKTCLLVGNGRIVQLRDVRRALKVPDVRPPHVTKKQRHILRRAFAISVTSRMSKIFRTEWGKMDGNKLSEDYISGEEYYDCNA
jgi:hypothetical protein